MRHRHSDIEYSMPVEDNSDVLAELNAEQILELVNQLPASYRTVFNLYIMEGHNHKEIGELLGISEGTSKSNLAKARMKLQKMIVELNTIKVSAYGK
jgi:RNA polymerase sigma-70 factor (ECF subfamily)